MTYDDALAAGLLTADTLVVEGSLTLCRPTNDLTAPACMPMVTGLAVRPAGEAVAHMRSGPLADMKVHLCDASRCFGKKDNG